MALTRAGLNACVAAGGITSETVVEAATELALEVSMVCAEQVAVNAAVARKILSNMVMVMGVVEVEAE